MKKQNKSPEKKEGDELKNLITQSQAAEIRGVTRAAIVDLVKRGRLGTRQIAGKTFVFRDEVEAFEPVHAGWPKGKSRKKGSK